MSAEYDSGGPLSCLEGISADITLTCLVTGTLSSNIEWSKDNSLMTTCSYTSDNSCIYSPGFSEPRYSFSSNVGEHKFFLQITPAATSTEIASFKCEHGAGSSDFDVFEISQCQGKLNLFFFFF